MTHQLLEALAYMHERGCAHRDIKVGGARRRQPATLALTAPLFLHAHAQAENVLLVDKESYKVKLADFGLSNALGTSSRAYQVKRAADAALFECRRSNQVSVLCGNHRLQSVLCWFSSFVGADCTQSTTQWRLKCSRAYATGLVSTFGRYVALIVDCVAVAQAATYLNGFLSSDRSAC